MNPNPEGGKTELRFRSISVDPTYMRSWLEEDFRRGPQPMPESLRKNRNLSIVLVAVQLLMAFGSLVVYVRRQSRVILFADIVSIALCLIGLYGTIALNGFMMFLHCFFCVSIFGAFYVYLLIEMFFLARPQGEGGPLSDTSVMFLMSIPYLVIFLVGCHSMYLFNMVYDERKARKEERAEIRLDEQLIREPLLPKSPKEV